MKRLVDPTSLSGDHWTGSLIPTGPFEAYLGDAYERTIGLRVHERTVDQLFDGLLDPSANAAVELLTYLDADGYFG